MPQVQIDIEGISSAKPQAVCRNAAPILHLHLCKITASVSAPVFPCHSRAMVVVIRL